VHRLKVAAMSAIHLDSRLSDAERRERIYAGDLFVYSPTPASLALLEFTREQLRAAFAPHDPEQAQFSMPVEAFAALLAQCKPRFIHHPECKRLLPALLAGFGCDPERTYFDVPRLRSATSDEYLSSGIAYAFRPHRDTWYSAPFCQINWWSPLYTLSQDNCMAFHPRYFGRALSNTSQTYNYQEWNRASRFSAAHHIGVDTREQPVATEQVELEPDLRLLPPPGGMIIFSAAQLHSTVPNSSGRTRFSVDFRTVHLDDVRGVRGARNFDSRCTGTTMGDYLRCTDLAHLPPEAAALYEHGPPQRAAGGS
jgi:hypothetical protein